MQNYTTVVLELSCAQLRLTKFFLLQFGPLDLQIVSGDDLFWGSFLIRAVETISFLS